ncbi:prenyltransferase [Exilibacterium tricleocarpae]|uniref:Prenyltransferase n=1 Tax=Exilibacterium tricleocarpae TaxID=2591008 RepID=A0A545SM06_9GAMM|nr:prenyltransferase [Exilibacterium tricleocarpae]TQV66002.1 prenyltransferase [Exilibacterium tricleocarpae]
MLPKGLFPEKLLRGTVDYILGVQLADGAIPWFTGGKTDPWDHVEAAMGLAIGGEIEAAERAYHWLYRQQLADGSWWANYQGNEPSSREQRETNFIAYAATGIWHHFLITRDLDFLTRFYPMVEKAIDFVLDFQTPSGEIHWAVNADNSPKRDALVTGCSSIYKSLECAINIAHTLGEDGARWVAARRRLGHTLRHHPECFDRTWESKARYSMDWFYPVLAGVIEGVEARQRLAARWSVFVEPELGCRCVSDEPWVTVAESCELTLALLAAGDHASAVNVYSWLHQFLDRDGGYWTGYVFPDSAIWPEEKTTWTAGAILLAADALTEHTGAARLFTRSRLVAPEPLPAPEEAEGIHRR